MNKVDPYSTIDHSHKNTRWIYVSKKCRIKCDKVLRSLGNRKNDDAIVSPKSPIQTVQKVQILTMQIKELKYNMVEIFLLSVNNENR